MSGVERTDAIRAKLDAAPQYSKAEVCSPEDVEWLLDEVEWLRTAHVVHCRLVALANPAPPNPLRVHLAIQVGPDGKVSIIADGGWA